MPVPKRKRSKARRDKRFATWGIKVKPFSECSNCHEPIASHQICEKCGFYKGAKVMVTKLDRKLKRTETRTAKQAQAPAPAEQADVPADAK